MRKTAEPRALLPGVFFCLLAFARRSPKFREKERLMPLPHFLALILTVLLAAGLTVWAAAGFGWPLGMVALGALATALAIRAFAWP